jgi:cell division septum initiation protein DivIVA|tara:strand:- start:446 stop:664 length:219 start_codon:yes stop_codon:yes gene_type:complete
MDDERLELDALLDEIKTTEQRLLELRKEYRERRTAGLRDAVAARNEADKAIQEELKALGGSYRYRISSPSFF